MKDLRARARQRALRDVFAGALWAAAGFALRLALDPWLGDLQPYAPAFVAVAASVALFGVRSATVTAILCYLWGTYFFVQPRGEFHFNRLQDIAGLVVNLASSSAIIYFGHRARLARQLAERFKVVQHHTVLPFTILEAVRAPDGTISDFTFSFVNDAAARYTGRPHRDLIGQHFLQVLPGARERLFHHLVAVCETGVPHDAETEYEADGITGAFRNVAVRLEDGVAITSVDISSIRKANRDLRERDALKDEFLAVLAHELRNPLAPIRSGLEVLRLRADTPAAVAQVRPMLERQVDQLVRMVDDLLDVARVSTGRIRLERGPVALREVLERALEATLPAAHAAGVALTSTLPPAEVVIDADAARLVQVFGNVLQNAVKFTPRGGRVALESAVEPWRGVSVIVRDTGCGIEAELLPRLFEFFVQGRDGSGLGIGLALSRRLLEMHGGTITAATDGPGKGCTFTIVLPVVATVVPAAAPVAGPAVAEAERVLVIDDSVDGTEMMAQVLQLLGVDVRTANSGEEGLVLAASFLPAIVLLDLGMPGMNGYEVCERLRALPGGAALRIIAVTGWGQQQDRVRSAAAGFDGHVTKPVDVDALAALLANGRSVSK